MFILPPDFVNELHPGGDVDDDGPAELALDWLVKKGLIAGKPYEDLPEISFQPDVGYGWRDFPHELVQSVWLEVRPKADGNPGLWVSAWFDDLNHVYPRLQTFDPLMTEAKSRSGSLDFMGMTAGTNTTYEFVEWPIHRPAFMPHRKPPAGAAWGLIDPTFEDHATVEGWIDDLDNVELQHLLFSSPEGTRFCPSLQLEGEVPAPCRSGTIAAAIFSNAPCGAEDQLGAMLLRQAKTISSAGLAFHDALLGYHRSLIERMFQD
jgi:hypothetical protein